MSLEPSADAAPGAFGVLYHSWPNPDGTLRLEFLSAGAEEMLEATAEDVAGMLANGSFPLVGTDAGAFYRGIEASLAGHTSWSAEFGYRGPRTGRVRWFRAQDFPRVTPDGVPHFAGVLIDVTGFKERIEREMAGRAELDHQLGEVRQYETLGVLAGGIAHDFNNLLTVILGNASVGRMTAAADHARQFADIETAAVRAADLCSQLTAYAGVGRLTVGPVDLGRFFEENEPAFRAAANAAELRVRVEPGLPAVAGDPRQFRQLVRNLVANAGEAMPRGGTVTVEAGAEGTPPDAVVLIRVTDTGEGMDEATKARVFDPYFTTKSAGRGLGMAAVKGIVRAHKGAIRVDSEPGKGTTVEVRLPVDRSAARPVAAEPPPSASASVGAALVVDDEFNIRELIASLLEEAGYRVTVAANGSAALTALRADPSAFTVAVVDQLMPGMSGLDLVGHLRAARPSLPVVLVTGFADRVLPEEVFASGPTLVLAKPFRLDALTDAVRRAVGR